MWVTLDFSFLLYSSFLFGLFDADETRHISTVIVYSAVPALSTPLLRILSIARPLRLPPEDRNPYFFTIYLFIPSYLHLPRKFLPSSKFCIPLSYCPSRCLSSLCCRRYLCPAVDPRLTPPRPLIYAFTTLHTFTFRLLYAPHAPLHAFVLVTR